MTGSADSIPVPPLFAEGIIGRPMPAGVTPRRIVVVRLHAFGDAVITLPVLAGLRTLLPESRIEFVTSEEYLDLFESLSMLDAVHGFPARASKLRRVGAITRLASRLGSPDLLLDLQRSNPSLLLGRLLRPTAWTAFDRFAPASALDRYLQAARWSGLDRLQPAYGLTLDNDLRERGRHLLASHAPASDPWIPGERRPLVALNPAGCWPTKNWPAEYYIELAARLRNKWNARIVLLGTENVRTGAAAISKALKGELIDLTRKTSTGEALAVVGELNLMVSDDSGLMHMAWVSGVPTVAMFGATRGVWSRPCGSHSYLFGSEDLECGACMSPVCARGDLLCLRRVDVEMVYSKCLELAASSPGFSIFP